MSELTSSCAIKQSSQRWFSELIRNVFVINLTRRPERWRNIWYQLTERAHIEPSLITRVPAIDGNEINLLQLYKHKVISKLGWRRLCEPSSHQIWGMDLNAYAVGCACSHFNVWSTIITENAEEDMMWHLANYKNKEEEDNCYYNNNTLRERVYMIVEDDSVFPENFVAKLQEWMPHVPKDWNVLYLSGLDTGQECHRLKVCDLKEDNISHDNDENDNDNDKQNVNRENLQYNSAKWFISRVPQLHRTTNAYLIKVSGAARLLQLCRPLTYQLDTTMTLVTSTRESAYETMHSEKHENVCCRCHINKNNCKNNTLDNGGSSSSSSSCSSINKSSNSSSETNCFSSPPSSLSTSSCFSSFCDCSHETQHSVPFVVDPICYTIQPTVVTQTSEFASDIQI